MNFYNKYILPKLLNFVMGGKEMEKHRPDVVEQVSGVVVEIGFGSGLNLPYYKNVSKLYALDPSQELYDLAEARIKSVSFPVEYIQASAEKIPMADNSVDFVVSTWSLCSIPNLQVALGEVYRVLKPNGKFVFIEHGKSAKSFVAKLQKLFTPMTKLFCGGCHQDREIDRLIMKAGFEIENLQKFQEKSTPFIFLYKGISCKK